MLQTVRSISPRSQGDISITERCLTFLQQLKNPKARPCDRNENRVWDLVTLLLGCLSASWVVFGILGPVLVIWIQKNNFRLGRPKRYRCLSTEVRKKLPREPSILRIGDFSDGSTPGRRRGCLGYELPLLSRFLSGKISYPTACMSDFYVRITPPVTAQG